MMLWVDMLLWSYVVNEPYYVFAEAIANFIIKPPVSSETTTSPQNTQNRT